MLADLNRRLADDEGHRVRENPPSWFEQRMRSLLEGDYQAVVFELADEVVAYALFIDQGDTVHLRQFFVAPGRRRQGLGREAFRVLKEEIWPRDKRLTVGVLSKNRDALAFWKSMGYREHSIELEIMPEDK